MDRLEFQPHVAVCPSSGVGHLTPFLRLASALSSCNCKVTFIAIRPTVSATESNLISTFFSIHPHIDCVDFHVLPPDPSHNGTTDDPFFLQFDAIGRSAHLLGHQLSSFSPSLSAVFSDLFFAKGISKILCDLSIPMYIVSTGSVRFLALMAHLPRLIPSGFGGDDDANDAVQIPGAASFLKSSIPPPFFNLNHLFPQMLASACNLLVEAKGIIINSFDYLEPESMAAFRNGQVLRNFPPVYPIGPLESLEQNKTLPWLDEQPAESVVYVCFGSRTPMTRDQIRELGRGLEISGYRFLWVIKTSKVDKEDKEELRGLLGEWFWERTKNRGVVLKVWVQQEEILAHPATGGFINHCGWNSVMEAARHGIPMLAWPQHGDQKINAEVVEKAGLGVWERGWGWGGERLVKGEEIAEKIKEIMTNEKLRNNGKEIGAEARKACETGGSSKRALMRIIETLWGKVRMRS